jgi:pimeloyl-ACP methyl ester carboxylesterase
MLLSMSKVKISRRCALNGVASALAGMTLTRYSHAAEVVSLRAAGRRTPVTFKSGGQTCAGVVHTPGTSFGRSPGVLMIHGLVGSKDQPHRMFVTLADALADAGFTSLRFDLRGRGDSDGQSIDITPRRDLEDARNALQLLREQPNLDGDHLIVLGLSWGGVLASIVADSPGVKRIVLLSSAPVDRDAWKPPPMKDYNGRRAADVYGNLIGKEFYDGLKELEPASVLKKIRRPVLMVHGTRDEAVAPIAYERFAGDMRFADVNVKEVAIDGADHGFMNYEWEKQAIEAVVQGVRT